MRINLFISLIAVTTLLSAADSEIKRNLTLDAKNIDQLEVDCGAGFLKIKGSPDTDRISVGAEIIIPNADTDRAQEIINKTMILTLQSFGTKARLEAGFDSKTSFFSSIFSRRGNPMINLTVTVPTGLALSVDDGSGNIYISNTQGTLFVDDGSGKMEIDHIKGNVRIDDGSGDIEITSVEGRVDIDDGSGGVRIENIVGNVFVDDGTGKLVIRDIDGDVEVDDGSGSVLIEGIEQDVIIKNNGSGGISIHNVKGKVYRYDD